MERHEIPRAVNYRRMDRGVEPLRLAHIAKAVNFVFGQPESELVAKINAVRHQPTEAALRLWDSEAYVEELEGKHADLKRDLIDVQANLRATLNRLRTVQDIMEQRGHLTDFEVIQKARSYLEAGR